MGRGRSPKSRALVQAAHDLLEEIQPASVRAVCYQLFVRGLIAGMDKTSTKRVGDLLTRAREEGEIPWEWIVQEGRAIESRPSWRDPAAFAKAVQASYRRNKWNGQPKRVIVVSEKGTVRGTLAPVLGELEVEFLPVGGFASATRVKELVDERLASDKPLLALYLGDHDPSGRSMSDADLPRRLVRYASDNPADRDWTDEEVTLASEEWGLEVRRIALTIADTEDLGRALGFPATDKRDDSRFAWFVRTFGSRCWELDAMNPNDLRERVRSAILVELDRSEWDRYVAAEVAERASIIDIYARKSQDDRDRTAEIRSTARQVEHATAYARQRGWTVDPQSVFVDNNVSGAIPLEARPGGAALLRALAAPQPPFSVLVVSELSRIGRDSIRTPYTVQQIEQRGVEIHGYLSGQRISVDDEQGEMQTMLHSLAASFERRRASQRTRDALLLRARAGHVANGACFGYRHVRSTPHAMVTREVVPDEAAVIRRIFSMAAAGIGFRTIAITLNDEGVRGPVSRRPGRAGGWAPSTVRAILTRDAYRGVAVWNKAARVLRGGTRKKIARPPDEWIRVPVQGLRIVSDAEWQAAHDRLAASRQVYLAATGGQRFGRPINGLPSRYLLTGFGTCGACGSSMFPWHRSHYERQRARPFFACVGHHQRGRAICQNTLTMPLGDVTEAVLAAIEHDLLNIPVLETALWKAMTTTTPAVENDRTRQLRKDLARLDRELANLTAAIAAGRPLPSLLTALESRERERVQVRSALAAIAPARGSERAPRATLTALRAAVADLRGTLRGAIDPARQVLRSLLAGRLIFTPTEHDGQRVYAFEGPGTVSRIITGLALPTAMMTG